MCILAKVGKNARINKLPGAGKDFRKHARKNRQKPDVGANALRFCRLSGRMRRVIARAALDLPQWILFPRAIRANPGSAHTHGWFFLEPDLDRSGRAKR
jgi:hypothetical protein